MEVKEQAEVRQQLIRQTLSATTLLEIEAAWQALQDWMQIHPEDEGMRAGFEQLAQMREITEMEDAQRTAQTAQAV
jgi:hypothetical protein